jgi:hypothetical protein
MTPDEEIVSVINRHRTAFTEAEVEEAEAALRDFWLRHPEFRINAEWFHGWHNQVALAEQRAREARQMGLSPAVVAERDALLKATLWDGANGADDLYDAERLRRDHARLVAWLRKFPDDPSVRARLQSIETDIEVSELLREASTGTRGSDVARELISV